MNPRRSPWATALALSPAIFAVLWFAERTLSGILLAGAAR